MNYIKKPVIINIKRNTLIVLLIFVALILFYYSGTFFRNLPSLVDWNTIFTLSGLLLLTTGIKESGLFYFLACRISRHIGNEQYLALFLVFLGAGLSMFLTNDIALFIIVPLTLGLQKIGGTDYGKIIIFEAIAVNVGSALTPVGNPQNIFIWHQWGVSFPVFVREMAPLVLTMSAILLVMVLFCVRPKPIKVAIPSPPEVDRKLFAISASLMLAFIISIEMQLELFFLPGIFLFMILFRRNIVFVSDWGIIILFILIFLIINLSVQVPYINNALDIPDYSSAPTLFFSGVFYSQIISNVPSAVLLENYSQDFKLIAYAVTVGGNGVLIGSFANLIAMRLSGNSRNYLLFHLYSLPYLIITTIISYYLFIV